jgi:hypothetical protein
LLPQNLVIFDKALCGGPQSRAAQRMFCHFAEGMRSRIACIERWREPALRFFKTVVRLGAFDEGFGL